MKTFTAILLLCLAASCTRQGDSTPASPQGETQGENHVELAQTLGAGNLGQASAMADSMALYVDDLSPQETVQVLLTFLGVHNEAAARHETRRDLETLRKYIDVYDIALGANPRDMRKALDKARSLNPEVDLDALAIQFRERLTQYDAVQDGSLTAPAPADTVSADTVSEEIPLELRPAE